MSEDKVWNGQEPDEDLKKNQIKHRAFQGAPDLVVEVLSPSSSKTDRTLKYRKYREAGVREYWIVDPKARRVTVHLFEKDDETTMYTFQDEIPVGIYGGECKISLAEVEKKEILLNELGII